MTLKFGPRRGVYIDVSKELKGEKKPLSEKELQHFEHFDLIYRSLCALLFNYVPVSGHPGGSISSGRIVQGILFDAMDYDVSDPDRNDADLVSFAAGHKALGDWQVALGINLRCQHLSFYTMAAQAKRDYPASIFFQSPWW